MLIIKEPLGFALTADIRVPSSREPVLVLLATNHPTAHRPELTSRTEQLLVPQLLYTVPCSVGATCAIGQRIHLLFPNSSPTLATICSLQPSTYHPLSIASVCRSTE